MNILNEKLKTNDFIREKVTITNSTSQVEYPEKTGRTEAKKMEILNEKNLARLFKELKLISKIMIISGNNAGIAFSALHDKLLINKKIKFAVIPHLGTRGINMKIKTDVNGKKIKSGDRAATYKRLEKIAEMIISVIKN